MNYFALTLHMRKSMKIERSVLFESKSHSIILSYFFFSNVCFTKYPLLCNFINFHSLLHLLTIRNLSCHNFNQLFHFYSKQLSSPHQSHYYAFLIASGKLCSPYFDLSYASIFVKLYMLHRGSLICTHTCYYKQLHQQPSRRPSCNFHLTTTPVCNSMSAFPWLWQFQSGRFRCSHSLSTAGKTRPVFVAAWFQLFQISILISFFGRASNLYLYLYNQLFALYHQVFKFLTPQNFKNFKTITLVKTNF